MGHVKMKHFADAKRLQLIAYLARGTSGCDRRLGKRAWLGVK